MYSLSEKWKEQLIMQLLEIPQVLIKNT